MTLELKLAAAIAEEADKLITRYHNYHNAIHVETLRQQKRTGAPVTKQIKIPSYWKKDKKFNPFYVKKKHKAIARSIARKINDGTYCPYAPHQRLINKSNGGQRSISIYQIPDAAVSKYFFNNLLKKNKHRFSAFSYAYRTDKNVHFAIQDIAVDLVQEQRVFVAEFDFSDFFGSIPHQFLYQQFDKNGFLVSDLDSQIIKAFLSHLDGVGVPQGTSISLFLANLVCWSLDRSLEAQGLKFARYADDTVIWGRSYEKICTAFNLISEFSRSTGIKINHKKSDGISLLSEKGLPMEIHGKHSIDFLGYSLGVGSVSIKKSSILKIKKQISFLLYKNLIWPLKVKKLLNIIIPNNNKDDDFLRSMMQIRRYVYGGLNREILQNFVSGYSDRIYFKGVMSFYPLLNDEEQLKGLDGWLVSVISRCLKCRANLLAGHGFNVKSQFPFNVQRKDLVHKCRSKLVSKKPLMEIPSFLLMHRAINKHLIDKGIEDVMNKRSINSDYD